MTESLAILDQEDGAGLTLARAPEVVLDEAHRAAAALKKVIDGKPNKVMFGGEQYLEYEDWQTVGRFYGVAPRIVLTRPITVGEASGWESTAEAVHIPSGRVVSSADAMCLTDEDKWRARPKYAWVYHKRSGGISVEDPGKDELIWEKGPDGKNRPKKSKELVGEEPVPSFQLRSMAQTRAAAKALRNALAWVVVLAGYRPTPAEELPGAVPTAQSPHPTPRVPEEPQQEDRHALLEQITVLGNQLGLDRQQRIALWQEHCDDAAVDVVDVAALGTLHAVLVARLEAREQAAREAKTVVTTLASTDHGQTAPAR